MVRYLIRFVKNVFKVPRKFKELFYKLEELNRKLEELNHKSEKIDSQLEELANKPEHLSKEYYSFNLRKNLFHTESDRKLAYEKTASAIAELAKLNGLNTLSLCFGSSLSLLRDQCFAPLQQDIDFVISVEEVEKLTEFLSLNPRFILTGYCEECLDITEDEIYYSFEFNESRPNHANKDRRICWVKYFDALTSIPMDFFIVHKSGENNIVMLDIPWGSGRCSYIDLPEFSYGTETYSVVSCIYPKYFSKMESFKNDLERVSFPILKEMKQCLDRWYPNWNVQKKESGSYEYFYGKASDVGDRDEWFLKRNCGRLRFYSNIDGTKFLKRWRYDV